MEGFCVICQQYWIFFKLKMPISTIKPQPFIFKLHNIPVDFIGSSVIYRIRNLDLTGWGFVALTKDHPSKISWMKWLQ